MTGTPFIERFGLWQGIRSAFWAFNVRRSAFTGAPLTSHLRPLTSDLSPSAQPSAQMPPGRLLRRRELPVRFSKVHPTEIAGRQAFSTARSRKLFRPGQPRPFDIRSSPKTDSRTLHAMRPQTTQSFSEPGSLALLHICSRLRQTGVPLVPRATHHPWSVCKLFDP